MKCTPENTCTVLYSAIPAGVTVIAADAKNVYWEQISNGAPSVMFLPHS